MESVTIKSSRQRRHLTLEQLSFVSGISYPHLSRLERALAPLNPQKAATLAEVLGVSAEALLRGQAAVGEALRTRLAAASAEGPQDAP